MSLSLWKGKLEGYLQKQNIDLDHSSFGKLHRPDAETVEKRVCQQDQEHNFEIVSPSMHACIPYGYYCNSVGSRMEILGQHSHVTSSDTLLSILFCFYGERIQYQDASANLPGTELAVLWCQDLNSMRRLLKFGVILQNKTSLLVCDHWQNLSKHNPKSKQRATIQGTI